MPNITVQFKSKHINVIMPSFISLLKKFLTIFLYSILTIPVSAQILKVDKGSLLLDSSRVLIGNIGLNFNVHNRSATSEKEITFIGLTGATDIVYLSEKHAYISINNIHYFKSTGGPLSSNGYSHVRANFLRKKHVSYETFCQIQYDDGRNMPFRFLTGGGVRLRIIESKKSSLRIGIGAMSETERWKLVQLDNTIISKTILKTSDYIGWSTKFNDQVDINLIVYYQGGFDSEDDLFRNRISGDLQFQIKVTDKLSFVNSFSCQYEDKPIIQIRKMVYSFTNGLMWRF